MTEKILRNTLLALLIAACALVCASCKGQDRVYPETYEELDGLRAGCMTGSIEEDAILNNFPNSPIQYFNAKSDMLEALTTNKIDYYVNSLIANRNVLEETDEVKMIDVPVYDNDYAFIFKKDDKDAKALMEQFNEFVIKCREDGTLDELEKVWVDDAKVTKHPPVFSIPKNGENGVLTLATSTSMIPFAFIYNEQITGFDIQVASMFCEAYGYGLQFTDSDFAGIIPAVSSGKADFGAGCITVTEERAKSVDFSEPYSQSHQYPMVANKDAVKGGLAGVAESFKKTFIVENRWKLICSGLLVTILITLSAAICGTALGFGLFMICRKAGPGFNKVVDRFSWVFSGLPMVVILMILYYIIFAKSSISGTVVASIAFSISIMLGVNSKLKTAVKSIDKGQIEGALSLGFTDTQTLFNYVLPQAMTQFIPNYLSALIELIKGTSIVGYIAVQDLTKASDIIRSRTYEAFFPLIATSVIYLLLVIALTTVLNNIVKKMEPKNRSDEEVLRRFGK
ncbi:MAG: ABC transporter substrate-binding protein/permease [Lachnospiraceae bacterium]|nr:ABC transporter substrate-binding protein/permease [Lachnospiraceae bacterium]